VINNAILGIDPALGFGAFAIRLVYLKLVPVAGET